MRAIVTGAKGFVGRALCAALGPDVLALSLSGTDWEPALAAAPLEGATIFHLAARVHDLHDHDDDAFERDNGQKTRRLAQAAARARTRRIVFLSTLKVLGEESGARPLRPDDPPRPADAYARSKLAGEEALREIAGAAGVEWVVVRSPLVYGAGARANLESLVSLCDSAWPLPFGAVGNRRSFVQRDDLARLLVACGTHPAAANRVFLAAHAEPASTPALVGVLRSALGRPARLWRMPAPLLELTAALVGQGDRMRRLTRSLEADPSAAREALGWEAHVGLQAAAAEMAQAWREART
jgi:nucleoside-diphosphate-sugar epimerase